MWWGMGRWLEYSAMVREGENVDIIYRCVGVEKNPQIVEGRYTLYFVTALWFLGGERRSYP
ncbi:hypothetical protein ACT29H_11240 [Thermophagus sp. OGC60D27]|uniref:hypothetical protein n=1 Tax=Thermophagus sp. OGC60D27 TaxID=3458415 RepID=UPI0040383A13